MAKQKLTPSNKPSKTPAAKGKAPKGKASGKTAAPAAAPKSATRAVAKKMAASVTKPAPKAKAKAAPKAAAKPAVVKPAVAKKAPVTKVVPSKTSRGQAPTKPTPSDSGKSAVAKAASRTKAEAKIPAVKPTPKPVVARSVAGVLQAARSVASKQTKVVESARESKSHLTSDELNEFKQILLDKRRELVEDMVNLEGEAKRTGTEGGSASGAMPIHMADLGTDTWEQEFTLNLIEQERTIVREIDEALERIERNTYGICLGTGRPISKARLRVKPWAKYCIEFARKRELGLG